MGSKRDFNDLFPLGGGGKGELAREGRKSIHQLIHVDEEFSTEKEGKEADVRGAFT